MRDEEEPRARAEFDAPAGRVRLDLPLATLAPGAYYLQFSVAGPGGPVDQRIGFRITR